MRNCEHCSSKATMCASDLKELPYENVIKIIDDAYNMGVKDIVLTGGEPLMYERLVDVVCYLHELGMHVTMYTYGVRSRDTAMMYRILLELGLDKIVYSVASSLTHSNTSDELNINDFFKIVFDDMKNKKLGFHYVVTKSSLGELFSTVTEVINDFKGKEYFDKFSILRFVPHGKGTEEMDISKDEYVLIKKFYEHYNDSDFIRLGSPWNILNISYSPCVIADEIMIIGFNGIAYPCDSVKYFEYLGCAGSIYEHSLEELYNSDYFKSIRCLSHELSCGVCSEKSICHGGCLGQKMLKHDGVKTLKMCYKSSDPKCLK